VLVITHNVQLINMVCDEIWILDDNKVNVWKGEFEEYRCATPAHTTHPPHTKPTPPHAHGHATHTATRARTRNPHRHTRSRACVLARSPSPPASSQGLP
jgi:ATPase subunit of ABC transporter with duplicated ATPase domains